MSHGDTPAQGVTGVPEAAGPMTTSAFDAIRTALSGATSVLILPHNDPDPDAIGSAVGLRYLITAALQLPATIAYQGLIGRAENKALVRYLGHPLQRFSPDDLQPGVAVVLVDSQPGTGNSPLKQPHDIALVVDHHPLNPATAAARFADVRTEVGAACTIVTEYIRAAGLDIPSPVATALFYGIKADTMGLGRSGTAADVAAYSYLVTRIDSRALYEIEQAQVPPGYFGSLVKTVQTSRIYRDVLIAYIGTMKYPDLAAEVADWLLRLKGIRWVICLGAYGDSLNLAVRVRHAKGGAGQLARAIVGTAGTAGGHGTMAGGQIRLDGREPADVAARLGQAVLAYFDIPPDEPGRRLLTDHADTA